MKKIISFFLILCCLKTFAQPIPNSSQIDRSFRPVWSIGMVGSQIDGDTYSGYHKLGYFFGLGINKQLAKQLEIEFDITFLQKGVRANYKTDSASLNNPNNTFSLIRLNYVEIPLYIRTGYKRFKFEAGGAIGYLWRVHDEDQYGLFIDNKYQNIDCSFLLGGGYKLSKNVLVNLRFEYSLMPVRPYDYAAGGVYRGRFGGAFNKGLYNNCLVLSLNYRVPHKDNTSTPANVQQ